MTTKETINAYFSNLNKKEGWQDYISENMAFYSPGQISSDKEGYVTATGRFLKMVESLEVLELIIEDNKVGALVNYKVKSPSGKSGNCEVAEIITVKDGKLASSRIYFDTAAFRNFIAQE